MANRLQNGVVSCPRPEVGHLNKCGYLFGYPLAHSLAPLLHRTVFLVLGLNWDYILLPSTDTGQFLDLVRDPKCYGSGVTMPNKVNIIPELDDITQEAEAVGACNTIFKRQSGLIGTNTDIIGVRESFFQNASPEVWSDRPALVIGAGGAARSAVYALVTYMKCKTVYLVNRDPEEVKAVIEWCTTHRYGSGLIHVETCSQARELEGPGAIVSCIPDCAPKTQAEQEVRKILNCFLGQSHKGAILEMAYHPTPWTEIYHIATKAGWPVILGTEAMIYQGLEQARYWTGREYEELPISKIKEAVANELSASA